MLKLFEQIFRINREPGGEFPESLVNSATERALDATDARVRILPGYAKTLRPSILHTITHIVQTVDGLAAPVPLSRSDWSSQPMLGAMFAGSDRLVEILQQDPALVDFREANPGNTTPITALLLADYNEKHTFGVDLVDDKLVSDVPQTVISFDNHRLQGLASDEIETRKLLKLRAFDYLQTLVLEKITSAKEKREDLQVRRKLLQAKLDLISRSSGSLLAEPRTADRQSLQQKMDQIEAELADLGAADTVLQQHLTIMADALAVCENELWLEMTTLYLDNMHIRRDEGHPNATALPLQLLHDSQGHRVAVLLVSLPADAALE